MKDRKATRLRRSKRTRYKIAELKAVRLTVTRSLQHISAQVFAPGGGEVLASASSMEQEIKNKKSTASGKSGVAELVGQLVAERAQAKGVKKVAFDRAGYMFHGRIKALALGARSAGLEF